MIFGKIPKSTFFNIDIIHRRFWKQLSRAIHSLLGVCWFNYIDSHQH